MAFRVAINGFGRIGRSLLRVCLQRQDIEIVAINDLFPPATLAYLLQYDSVMGQLPQAVTAADNVLVVADHPPIRIFAERDPGAIAWQSVQPDVVVESTGRFTRRADLEKHLHAGAKRVLLTVPAKDAIDNMVVLGVNDATLTADQRLISNASCTTNCLAPVAKVLDEHFGICQGLMTTIHAFTNDQRLLDAPHSDLRRARAATHNLIPTTTGAARAVGKVLPALQGKLDGMALRVNVIDGSCIDLLVTLAKSATVKDVNQAMQTAAAQSLHGILAYNEAPLVSRDILGNSHSSIFDAPLTQSLPERKQIRIVSWYDNEWGYSNRCADLIARMAML